MMQVFCRRSFRAVHRHPHVSAIPSVANRPHLGRDHEHQIRVTVWAEVPASSSREVDLLDLQNAMDELVTGKVIPFGVASFEQMALWVAGELHENFPTVSQVEIEADGVEGALMKLEDVAE